MTSETQLRSRVPTPAAARERRRSPAVRLGAATVGALAVATLLGACDKPRPTVTMLSNGDSKMVSAQPACTVLGSCQPDPGKVRQIKAAGGSQVLVDVPKALADGGWIVAAFTSDGTKNTALTTPGASSGPIRGEHTVRLQVPTQTTGSYYLQVTALKPDNQLTTWLVGVQLTQ